MQSAAVVATPAEPENNKCGISVGSLIKAGTTNNLSLVYNFREFLVDTDPPTFLLQTWDFVAIPINKSELVIDSAN